MQNINIKSSFIHMMSDLLSSVAIIIGGVIVYFTDLFIIDTLLAVFIAVVMLKLGYSFLKNSINVLLESSPVDIIKLKDEVIKSGRIEDIHDIYIAEISDKMYILTAHILIKRVIW